MFDLIDECGRDLKRAGFKTKSLYGGVLSHSTIKILDDAMEREYSLERGEYHIFNLPSLYDDEFENGRILQEEIAKVLSSLLKKDGYKKKDRVLIVGLGNGDVECDRLGKEVFDRILISPFKEARIYKFCPSIFFLTGINAIDLVKMLVERFNISFVFLIDSLTTNSLARLGRSFQISTTGLTPGSGVNRFGKRISREEIMAKTITLGVPFMINSSSLKGNDDILLCPKDISSNIALAGEIIARGINEVIK